MSQAENEPGGPWYPTPFTLVLWGLPVALLGMWLVAEGREEGSLFITGLGTVVGAVAWAVTAIGVVAQGIRFGMTWVDHDRQSSVSSP
jgi:hypothetical protein